MNQGMIEMGIMAPGHNGMVSYMANFVHTTAMLLPAADRGKLTAAVCAVCCVIDMESRL